MSENIKSWLEAGGLAHKYDDFRKSNINDDEFLNFTMADYALVNVTSLQERKKMFTLLQQLQLQRRKFVAPDKENSDAGAPRPLNLERIVGGGLSSPLMPSAASAATNNELLLFSPLGSNKNSIDLFDSEKDRALSLMNQIDLKYKVSKVASPPTSNDGSSSSSSSSNVTAVSLLQPPPPLVSESAATSPLQPTANSVISATAPTGSSSSSSSSTVRNNSRASARAAANKRSTTSSTTPTSATVVTSTTSSMSVAASSSNTTTAATTTATTTMSSSTLKSLLVAEPSTPSGTARSSSRASSRATNLSHPKRDSNGSASDTPPFNGTASSSSPPVTTTTTATASAVVTPPNASTMLAPTTASMNVAPIVHQPPLSRAARAALAIENEDNADLAALAAAVIPYADARERAAVEAALTQKIRVAIRKRPLSSSERRNGERDIVQATPNGTAGHVIVNEPKLKLDLTPYIDEHSFVFDEAFGERSTNAEVYRNTARPLVDAVFKGARATCFAYGQTGSGKTHTMLGADGGDDGLYVLAAADLFARLARAPSHIRCHVAFFEIYGGKLFDLLGQRALLHARDNGLGEVIIRGLSQHIVADTQGLLNAVRRGMEARSVGSTAANQDSSRSHAVLQLSLGRGGSRRVLGQLTFVDLAGSERGSETGKNLDRQTMLEGAEINKSLLALKECIRALDQDKAHLPFRQSALTQVLKDSFIGDGSRTVMIATVSPASAVSEHTLNTLRYADRVKEMSGPRTDQQQQPQQQQQSQMQHQQSYQQSYQQESQQETTTTTVAAPVASVASDKLDQKIHSKSRLPQPLITPHRKSTSSRIDAISQSTTTTTTAPPPPQNVAQPIVTQQPTTTTTTTTTTTLSQQQQQQSNNSNNDEPIATTTSNSARQRRVSLTPRKLLGQRGAMRVADDDHDQNEVDNAVIARNRSARAAEETPVVVAPVAADRNNGVANVGGVNVGGSSSSTQIAAAVSDVVARHRASIDASMAALRAEMQLLDRTIDSVSEPRVELYLAELDMMLESKLLAINSMRSRIATIRRDIGNNK